jgi:hypothetical protein
MSRIKVGDKVFVRGWPPVSLEVIDTRDRSIITLRSEHGALVKVGRLVVVKVQETEQEIASL